MSWNHPSEKKVEKVSVGGVAWKRGLIAGGIVVVVALIAAWFVFSGADEADRDEKARKVGLIKETKPAVTAKTNAVEVAEVKEETDPKKRIVEVVSCSTNKSFGRIVRVVRTADGKTHKEIHFLPPPFKHGTDQMLAVVLNPNPNGGTLPMPRSMFMNSRDLDKEFRESLKDPIVINEDDSPKLQENKRKVMEAREQIKELMDQGLHFQEILDEHKRLLQENAEIRNKAMRELRELRKAGDKEGERQYQVTIDAALQQMGIEPMDDLDQKEALKAQRIKERAERQHQKENSK